MSDKIRIAAINMMEIGSTGTIMLQIAEFANKQGMHAETFSTYLYGFNQKNKPTIQSHSYYGWYGENALHTVLGKISGYNGCFSYFGTKQLIRYLKELNPHILHLHNLHQFCINLPMLFRYVKKNNIRVVWTLHDCWTFTGHCPHFAIAKCDKWKTGCYDCPQYHKYPKTYVDRSKSLYRLKKKWFNGVSNMTLVTPSEWLADMVRQSYLGSYPVHVIPNGVDLSVFKPTQSDFRKKYACQDKKIVLGVCFSWGYSKGLDVFAELAKRLDSSYQIVLVGTNDRIDAELPDNILSVHRTENRSELAGLYTTADVFINPTREETLGLVNLEAIACGTPVLTFAAGGSPETIPEGCGVVVRCDDVDAMEQHIKRICQSEIYESENIVQKARQFDLQNCFSQYINLYREIMQA